METLRVLIDSTEPCDGCGSPSTVFQRSVDGVEWVDEHHECSHGCDEFAAAIPAGAPRQRTRRSRVA